MSTSLGSATAAVASALPDDGEEQRRRGPAGYFLLGPGLVWLLLFFIVPFVAMTASSKAIPSIAPRDFIRSAPPRRPASQYRLA